MAPLTGYNSNVRHRGRMFHIQTEDTGEISRRVVTQLFADGGRIVKSFRAEYAEHLADLNWPNTVREIMKDQHKAMFVSLRSGELDEVIGFGEDAPPPTIAKPSLRAQGSPKPRTSRRPSASPSAPVPPAVTQEPPSSGARAYAAPRPCAIFSSAPKPAESLFGGESGTETLDSAILEYLADAGAK